MKRKNIKETQTFLLDKQAYHRTVKSICCSSIFIKEVF